jgi:hypothetical protein
MRGSESRLPRGGGDARGWKREEALADEENEHCEKEGPPYLSLQGLGASAAFLKKEGVQRSEQLACGGWGDLVGIVFAGGTIDGNEA